MKGASANCASSQGETQKTTLFRIAIPATWQAYTAVGCRFAGEAPHRGLGKRTIGARMDRVWTQIAIVFGQAEPINLLAFGTGG